MADLRIATNNLSERLESDREVLPFPRGGVFGNTAKTAPNQTVLEIGKTLDNMQRQLSELSDAVDEVLKFSDYNGSHDCDDINPQSAA